MKYAALLTSFAPSRGGASGASARPGGPDFVLAILRRAPRVPGAVMRHPYLLVSAAALVATAFTVAAA